jgi:hypothetical protein
VKIIAKSVIGLVIAGLVAAMDVSAQTSSDSSDGPVIQQTLVPASARSSTWPPCPYDHCTSNRVQCKMLSVGADSSSLVTITLVGRDGGGGDLAEVYSDGFCKKGSFTSHTMVRVASGSPQYKWMGAWCQPYASVQFHPNGQVSFCSTSRSWLDLSPGRVAVAAGCGVQLDSNGRVTRDYCAPLN